MNKPTTENSETIENQKSTILSEIGNLIDEIMNGRKKGLIDDDVFFDILEVVCVALKKNDLKIIINYIEYLQAKMEKEEKETTDD